MLKVKKINKNKLISYIVVIVFMFFGTLFFIYKNYELSKQSNLPMILLGEGENEIIINQNKEKYIVINEEINKNKVNESIDLNIINFDILNNSNYKNLVDNRVEPVNIELGNKNLFEYYDKAR
jgi:hypothetical protein